MKGLSDSRKRIQSMLVLILAGETIFFLPFLLLRIFRPTFLRVFEVDNLTIGWCFSVYGIVALISYFFGGLLADRFSARKIMAAALSLTALGGLLLMQFPDKYGLAWLYGFWGMTTIMLFWSAMLKATSQWGKGSTQNRAFGLLESGRGLAAASVVSILLAIANPNEVEIKAATFQYIIGLTAGITFLVGVLTWIFVRVDDKRTTQKKKFDIELVLKLCQSKNVVLLGVIVVCAYTAYKTTDDFSLYAHEVLKFDESESALLATVAFWLRPAFALIAIYFADKFGTARFMSWCFLIMMFSGMMVASGWFNSLIPLALIVLTSTAAGIYAIRAIYFALVKKVHMNDASLGTVIGIISVIGYTPDIFMGPLSGLILDENKGATGHQYLFLTMAAFALVGYLTTLVLRREIKFHSVS